MSASTRSLSRRIDPLLRRMTGIRTSEWGRVARGVKTRAREGRLSLVAAGIGYWFTLSLFPTLIVLVTLFGLVADAGEVERQVDRFLGAISPEAKVVVTEQLQTIAGSGGLGWGLLAGLVGVFWTASSGTASAIKAVALAYGEREQRSFVRLRAMALAFTLAGFAVVAALLAMVAFVPIALEGAGGWGRVLAAGRWVVIVGLMAAAIAALYRFAPQDRHGGWQWSVKAAVAASVAWAVATGLFSLYVRSFADFAATYGAITGLIVLMVWFYLTGLLITLGAAIAAVILEVDSGRPIVGPAGPEESIR
jgi:membrane protein